MTISELERNLVMVNGRIQAACVAAGRLPDEVTLIAATKMQSTNTLLHLYELGVRDFGENRVQELIGKRELLPKDIRWHFIGHLQTNKSKLIAPFITMVHSVDSFEIAIQLSARAVLEDRTIPVLIEVNISQEESKEGVESSEAEPLVAAIAEGCPGLELRGLMGMASYEEVPARTTGQFEVLRSLRESIKERHPELKAFKELSMGMTNDFDVAIEEGATMIRIGSALFGERTY